MHVFHIASEADWSAAKRSGAYLTSTRGRTLEQEGFIHTSRREQVAATFRRFYADADEPLVLLTVDTDRLTSPWQVDAVGDDTYPHVYGPINAAAVVRVQPIDARGATGSFTSLLAKEMGVRVLLAMGAMVLAVLGAALGRRTTSEWGGFVGALAGLAVGLAGMAAVLRRRS